MRFLLAALLVFALAAPAWAQQYAPTDFAVAYCPQTVPCPDSAQPLSSEAVVSIANACVTRYFGVVSAAGFFDEIAGLDSNNCLSPLSAPTTKSSVNQLFPACCVVARPGNTNVCVLRCQLNKNSP